MEFGFGEIGLCPFTPVAKPSAIRDVEPFQMVSSFSEATSKPPYNRRTMKPANLVKVSLCALMVCFCGTAAAQTPSGAEFPRAASESASREFGGIKCVTRPSRDATMGFQLPTQITRVMVKGGQTVKKDDPLVQGDDSEDVALAELQRLRAETDVPIRVAEKARDLAQLEYERIQTAFGKNASNQQEFDRAKLTWERAVLEHENATQQQRQEVVGLKARQARVEKLTLRAPFDGVIDTVLADAGQTISENRDVLRIVNVERLWIDADAPIDDPMTLRIKEGDTAWVLVDVLGQPKLRTGKVIEVAPAAHPVARTRRIRVELENGAGADQLLAGDTAWVRFTAPPEDFVRRVTTGAAKGTEARS